MQRTTEAFKWPERVMALGIIASIFSGPGGEGGAIPTIAAVHGTDWTTLAQALQSFPIIKRDALWKMASIEELNHGNTPGSNGNKLRLFWHAMAETLR